VQTNRTNAPTVARQIFAALTVLAFAFALALESLPELHDHIHADAHETEHHCVVTILQQGQVDLPDAQSPLLFQAFSFHLSALIEPVTAALNVELLADGRAPPALS
jgi:hypothetical protein